MSMTKVDVVLIDGLEGVGWVGGHGTQSIEPYFRRGMPLSLCPLPSPPPLSLPSPDLSPQKTTPPLCALPRRSQKENEWREAGSGAM